MKGYNMGKDQGDMKPHVKDYQPKMNEYSQKDMNKTLDYIEKRDRIQSKQASQIKSQDYKGRYD